MFYGDGISFRLSLANHSDSESFLVVHALFSQDGCPREGFWEVVGQVVFPLTFPELFWLVEAYSFPVPYQDLLSLNNSCKCLLWCLASAGVSPNKMIFLQAPTWLAAHFL